MQDHEKYILTSSKFASDWQISSLALACNKIEYRSDGEYMKSPFQEISSGDTPLIPNESNPRQDEDEEDYEQKVAESKAENNSEQTPKANQEYESRTFFEYHLYCFKFDFAL